MIVPERRVGVFQAHALWALIGLLLLTGIPSVRAAEEASSPPAEKGDTAPGTPLKEWRSAKESADELQGLPKGPERISRCEKFLKEHPDYPDPRAVLRMLVDDLLETPDFDPAAVARLLERLAALREDRYGRSGLSLVERYYLKHNLPLDSAQRILAQSRSDAERSRSQVQKEADPKLREQIDDAAMDFLLPLDEGRVLLAKGDTQGALKRFLEAEKEAPATGSFIHFRTSPGPQGQVLLLPSPAVNWLNLSLAEAYARLGDRVAAAERLERIRGSGGALGEIDSRLDHLRAELKIPTPQAREFRADPVPAPDFTLEDLEGNKVSLSDLRGNTVLVYLWATG